MKVNLKEMLKKHLLTLNIFENARKINRLRVFFLKLSIKHSKDDEILPFYIETKNFLGAIVFEKNSGDIRIPCKLSKPDCVKLIYENLIDIIDEMLLAEDSEFIIYECADSNEIYIRITEF